MKQLKLFSLLMALLLSGAACSHTSSVKLPQNRLKTMGQVKSPLPALPAEKFSSSALGKRKISYPLMTKTAAINIWEMEPSPHGPTPNNFPIVEIKTDTKRTLVSLKEFSNFSVTHVFQDLPGGKILILLDYAVEGPLEEYAKIVSSDEGLSWKKISPLPKNPGVFPFGELASLWGDSKGKWTAHFSQDNKIYQSRSDDDGETWQPEASPIHENEWTSLPPSP